MISYWRSLKPFPKISQQGEFQEAAELLSKAIWPKGKHEEKKHSEIIPGRNGIAIPSEQSESLPPQNPADFQTGGFQANGKDPESSLVCNSSRTNTQETCDLSRTESPQQRPKTDLLASDKHSPKFSHDTDCVNNSRVKLKTGLENLRLADNEQDTESDDELEQFVFQPKNSRQ